MLFVSLLKYVKDYTLAAIVFFFLYLHFRLYVVKDSWANHHLDFCFSQKGNCNAAGQLYNMQTEGNDVPLCTPQSSTTSCFSDAASHSCVVSLQVDEEALSNWVKPGDHDYIPLEWPIAMLSLGCLLLDIAVYYADYLRRQTFSFFIFQLSWKTRVANLSHFIAGVTAALMIVSAKKVILIYTENCLSPPSNPGFCTMLNSCNAEIRSVLSTNDSAIQKFNVILVIFIGFLLLGVMLAIWHSLVAYENNNDAPSLLRLVNGTAAREIIMRKWNYDVELKEDNMECPICLGIMLPLKKSLAVTANNDPNMPNLSSSLTKRKRKKNIQKQFHHRDQVSSFDSVTHLSANAAQRLHLKPVLNSLSSDQEINQQVLRKPVCSRHASPRDPNMNYYDNQNNTDHNNQHTVKSNNDSDNNAQRDCEYCDYSVKSLKEFNEEYDETKDSIPIDGDQSESKEQGSEDRDIFNDYDMHPSIWRSLSSASVLYNDNCNRLVKEPLFTRGRYLSMSELDSRSLMKVHKDLSLESFTYADGSSSMQSSFDEEHAMASVRPMLYRHESLGVVVHASRSHSRHSSGFSITSAITSFSQPIPKSPPMSMDSIQDRRHSTSAPPIMNKDLPPPVINAVHTVHNEQVRRNRFDSIGSDTSTAGSVYNLPIATSSNAAMGSPRIVRRKYHSKRPTGFAITKKDFEKPRSPETPLLQLRTDLQNLDPTNAVDRLASGSKSADVLVLLEEGKSGQEAMETESMNTSLLTGTRNNLSRTRSHELRTDKKNERTFSNSTSETDITKADDKYLQSLESTGGEVPYTTVSQKLRVSSGQKKERSSSLDMYFNSKGGRPRLPITYADGVPRLKWMVGDNDISNIQGYKLRAVPNNVALINVAPNDSQGSLSIDSSPQLSAVSTKSHKSQDSIASSNISAQLSNSSLRQSSDAILVQVPCGHIFHRDCILEWVNNGHLTCPSCRANLSTGVARDERTMEMEEEEQYRRNLMDWGIEAADGE